MTSTVSIDLNFDAHDVTESGRRLMTLSGWVNWWKVAPLSTPLSILPNLKSIVSTVPDIIRFQFLGLRRHKSGRGLMASPG